MARESDQNFRIFITSSHLPFHLLIIRTTLAVEVSITRELLELIDVDFRKLWARQSGEGGSSLAGQFRHGAGDTVQDAAALDEVWGSLDGELHGEASQVVAFGQGLAVEDSASEVLRVDSGESVDFSSVASDGEEFRILGCGKDGVCLQEGDAVFITDCALIPVVGNALEGRSVAASFDPR